MPAFDPRNPNLKVWLREEPTDPAFTKPITGKPFKGTALNGEYVMKRLTDAFGPIGLGWGYTATFEDVHSQHGESLNFCMLSFWYYPNGCGIVDGLLVPLGPRSETISQVGGTQLFGTYSSGKTFADDEARKKSITDAILKVASHIGIGGDIHLGMYDDSKYLNDRKAGAVAEQVAVERDAARSANEDALREAQAVVESLETAGDAPLFNELRALAIKLYPAIAKIDAMKAETLHRAVVAAAARLGVELPAPKKKDAA